MITFPTLTCIDDFFDDPDSVRDYALSCTFYKVYGIYPGVRTDPLHLVNPTFYESVVKKIKNIFYQNINENADFELKMYFQQMFKFSKEITDPINVGWSHIDRPAKSAGLVYLNKSIKNIDSGTIICDQKDFQRKKPYDFFYRNAFYGNEDLISDKKFMKEYKKSIISHNEHFDDSVIIKNKYNRFIFYGGDTWHREQNVSIDTNENRLTLVMFLK
jgi:hypothetical protein